MSASGILAHGLGGRGDLPVPLWLAQYAAVAALVVSFAMLVAYWREPRLEGAAADARPLPDALQRFADAPTTRAALRAFGLLLALVTVVVAAFGPNNSAANPAPTWVYVWFWVGLVFASLLLGPVWRLLNPLRTISAGLARLAGDPDQERTRPLPPGSATGRPRPGWPSSPGWSWSTPSVTSPTRCSPSSCCTPGRRWWPRSGTASAGTPAATASRSTPPWSATWLPSAGGPTAASGSATPWPGCPPCDPRRDWWRWSACCSAPPPSTGSAAPAGGTTSS